MARHTEALAHSGDAEATERFLRSLEEEPGTHSNVPGLFTLITMTIWRL